MHHCEHHALILVRVFQMGRGTFTLLHIADFLLGCFALALRSIQEGFLMSRVRGKCFVETRRVRVRIRVRTNLRV